jgi:TetR/AcrR family acrAB operon transcriptional repressor
MTVAPRRAARRTPVPSLGPRSAGAQTRIVDAALVEFVEHGFAGASTNAIARAARVAKGLVFHHFTSKANLYLAVIDDAAARITQQVFDEAALPADLFERLFALAVSKVQVYQRDPLRYRLLFGIHDAPRVLRARIERRLAALRANSLARMLDGIDPSRLRPGVTLAQAVDTLLVLADGIDRRYLGQLAALPDRGASQLAAITREVWAYFERLRDGLYVASPAARPRRRVPG